MATRTLSVMSPSKSTMTLQAVRAVLYVRVSSKDQEKEGFSIPAQQKLLREYATRWLVCSANRTATASRHPEPAFGIG